MNNVPPVNQEFDTARNQAEHDRVRQQALDAIANAERLDAGNISESQLLRPVKAVLVEKDENGRPIKTKSQKLSDKAVFKNLLKQISDQIADIEQQMAELFEILQAKYGDDVVGGIAATHLPPEVLDKLKTEEDKMRALAELMLNPDGTIKDKYKDSVDAQYIQAWQQAQQLLDKRMNLFTSDNSADKQTVNQALESARNQQLESTNSVAYKFI